MKIKIFFSVNTAWNLINFRSGLMSAIVDEGYDVIAVAPYDRYVGRLQGLGVSYIPINIDNKGTNPFKDFLLLFRYILFFLRERPDVYLGYTVKPNIYGSIAARVVGIPVINNVAGLGTVFHRGGWLNRLVRFLYRLALSRSSKVFFQNDDDLQLFVDEGLVSPNVVDRLPGSGVDLQKFSPLSLPNKQKLRFLLVARMLWDKGVGEFVEAARLCKQRGLDAEFCLLGFLDVQNPAAISHAQMAMWESEGVVTYLGVSDVVAEELAKADCVVLPSFYREGTPRALLEAAAMARPIITTDAIGCREVVDDGENGYLCRPRDGNDLAEKIMKIAALSPAEREIMGVRGRAKMEREYDEEIVIQKYLEAISSVLKK